MGVNMSFKKHFLRTIIESVKDLVSSDEYNALSSNDTENISHSLQKIRRTDRSNSNLKPAGIGSSREYYRVKTPEHITLDGEKVPVDTGIKVAYKGKFGVDVAKTQNQNESRPELNNHYIIKKDEHGNYHTNENGIILPTLDHDKNNNWVHTLHVEPLSDKTKLQDYTKTESHPNGISGDDVEKAFLVRNGKSDHPFIKKVKDFADAHNIAYRDIHGENVGIFTHPITKKKYPVLLDHGVTNGLLSGDN